MSITPVQAGCWALMQFLRRRLIRLGKCRRPFVLQRIRRVAARRCWAQHAFRAIIAQTNGIHDLRKANMSSFAAALKNEMRRVARREIKATVATTIKSVARYRREIAALKRRLQAQEKATAKLRDQLANAAQTPEVADDGDTLRFSARSVKAQRRRSGLSASDYAKLIGVSPLTIYNWERGKSRPRQEQFSRLVAVRGLGKREALARISELGAQPSTNGRHKRKTT